MCDFCHEFAAERTAKSRIALSSNGFITIPTLGCFVDGYGLTLPREHVPSYACLGPERLRVGLELLEKQRVRLEHAFGKYILAEHGAADFCDLGSGCCEHAHVHVIPMRDRCAAVVARYFEAGGPPERTGGIDIFEGYSGSPYLMLSTSPGEYLLWRANHAFSRQFVRRVCAELLGRGELYNWRSHAFVPNMLRTKLAIEALCEVL
jgi:hypothetical protein